MSGQPDIWAKIAAPVPSSVVQWRQQGRATQRDGHYVAPFVAYIDAQFVRERLDAVVAGEWDLTLELLPNLVSFDGEAAEEPCAFKARLKVLGVEREDVGTGRDYKNAATDAFKRAAVRFGIGHELYTDYSIVWVRVDGDGKYAKPMEDPSQVWGRKSSGGSGGNGRGHATAASESHGAPAAATAPQQVASPASAPTVSASTDEPSCPKCGGKMWDNRLTKRSPRAPDWKCKTRTCDGVIWPERSAKAKAAPNDEPPEFGDMPPVDDYPY